MMISDDELEEFAAERKVNAAESLGRVAEMADALTKAMIEVNEKEDALSVAKGKLRTIEEEDFPALLNELELTEVKLKDGRSIKLDKDIKCHISEERIPKAHGWLRENGFGGIIKALLTLSFGKGEEKAMTEAEMSIFKATGIAPERSENVHPSTLKSFLKEQRSKAADGAIQPPEDLFGIRTFEKVKVKSPK